MEKYNHHIKRLFYLVILLHGSLSLVAQDRALQSDIQREQLFIQRPEGKIYGSLVCPVSDHGIPLVLFVSGSGPTDRDGNTGPGMKNDALKKLAAALARHEIASFRFDKKGVGASENSLAPEDIRLEHFVKDISSWTVHFRSDSRFDRIIILGHSLGALMGMKSAQMIDVDGFVSLAGPGESLDKIIYNQLEQRSSFLAKGAKPLLDSLAMGEKPKEINPLLYSIIPPNLLGYLISVIREDPAEEISKLDIPCLIIVGSHDVQVRQKDAELLHDAATNSEMIIIEGMNHVLRDAPLDFNENIKTYNQADLPLHAQLVDIIVKYISETKP